MLCNNVKVMSLTFIKHNVSTLHVYIILIIHMVNIRVIFRVDQGRSYIRLKCLCINLTICFLLINAPLSYWNTHVNMVHD